MTMKPVFKGKEIVVKFIENGLNLGGSKEEMRTEVLYVGEEQEKYKVGDIILYNEKAMKKDLNYFGETLRVLRDENMVICKIEE